MEYDGGIENGVQNSSFEKGTTLLKEVIKSPVDKREYRAFVLANGLTAIVVSDPKTDKSAAALDVMTGSLNDPKELPGLAHYLEHMLFMGTEKYPEENAYAKYLAENAGSSNAYTSGDNTCFYFDCSPQALNGAVDRFAQFFISPLFSDSCNEREVNAVHSEHEGNVPDDGRRKYRVDSFLTKPSHPYSFFPTGNKDTLWNLPKKNNIDVKSELLKFYRANYSANIMKLVVVGKESCDELQQMVETYFQDVKNFDMQTPHWPESPFGVDESQTRIDILPVMDIRELSLVFPIPDLSKKYKCGAATYLKSVIGHEGPGSLLSLLKKKNWATDLTIWSDAPGRGFAFIYIDIDLTPLGLEVVDDIISHIFQYLNMMRDTGPQRWYWDEIKVMKETAFKFLEDQSADDIAVDLVDLMATYPPEEVWTSRYVLSDYQPTLITNTLQCLVPDNVRIILQTKENADKVSDTEQYYGSKYSYGKIDENLIQNWKNCGTHPELQFPTPNLFVPSEFDLKPRDKESGIIPRIVLDDELSRVWFLQDNEFLLPRAIVVVDIINPCPKESPKNYNLQCLLESVAEDELAEYCYPATLAGLSYNISSSLSGMRVQVSGYDHKVATLFDHILKYLVNFDSVGNRFEDLKEAFIRDLKNWKDEEPASHASSYVNELFASFAYSNKDLLSATDDLTPENLLGYVKKMLSGVKLQWLIGGNMTEEEALAIHSQGIQHFLKIGSKSLYASQLVPGREIELPTGCNYLYSVNHETHSNSCVHMVLQFEMGDLRQSAVLKIIDHILSEPCFDILRTKEQLGYYTGCMYRKSKGVLGLELVVQGEKHPEFLESRVENFLELMATTMNELTSEAFETYRNSLIVIQAKKPKTLSHRFNVIDSEISRRNYNFDVQNMILQELSKVTLDEAKEFYKEWIKPGAKQRKKIAVHVVSVADGGAGHQASLATRMKRSKSQDLIGDLVSWKSSRRYYPYPKPFGNIPPWKTGDLPEL